VDPDGRGRSRLTRPQRWMIALALLMLTLGLMNLARSGLTLRYAARLPDLPMTVGWPYLVAVSAFWGVAQVICAVGLTRFLPWGRWSTLMVATCHEIHAWVDHLLFDANDYARQVWPRDLVWTIVFLVAVWGLLSWPSVREVFRE